MSDEVEFGQTVSSEQEWLEEIAEKHPSLRAWPGKDRMTDMLKINVNEHTEKKGSLTYLSWAWAWAEVLKIDPAATWKLHTFGDDPQPFMRVGKTALVFVSVRINGTERHCQLPVMDHKNKAIPDPDAFQVNTAIMRCLAKAIAMHGLGLYIYAGEDLPEGEEAPDKPASPVPATFRAPAAKGPVDVDGDRQTMIGMAASIAVEKFKRGEKDASFDTVAEYMKGDDETLYLFQILAPHSTLRAYLKFRQEQAAKRQPEEQPA